MSMTFTVKSESLAQLRPEIARIQASFNVAVEIQEKAENELLSWIGIKGQRQREAKDYITTFCNPECTQFLVCPAHFTEYVEDTRRRLEANYKVVCRLFDDLSMEICGSTLDVTLAASAFDEIINQLGDNVAKERKGKNHDEIIDSHLCSFAQNEEWQGLDVEASMNLPSHVKRALLSVLSEEPFDGEYSDHTSPDVKCANLGEVSHTLNSTDEDGSGFNASVVCSTVKKKPKPGSSSRMAARFPEQHTSLDGSYIDDQESVIFIETKVGNPQFDESIIGGNVTMSPKTKKMRLDTIDTINIGSPQNEEQDAQQTLVEVLMEVGYERWAIEAAQATLSEADLTNHKKILGILQSQKNENKLKSLTLPSDMHKIKKENVRVSETAIPLPEPRDLSFLSLSELEKKHQQLINLVSNRQPKSMFTPMKSGTFGSPSLPQSTPLVKFDTAGMSTLDELDETVVDAGSRKKADPQPELRCLNEDVEYIGELKVKKKPKTAPEDWIYVSSSSSGESSSEGVQKKKLMSEKSFVSAIETELVARQESNLLTQKAELEEEMRKQQDDIMKELEKRYNEQHKQMRLENEKLQKQQEESMKELRQMMEKQNKEQLKKNEQLKKELNKKEKKDKEIKELEEQAKMMQKALKQQEETMKQLQQQQHLANMKTQHLPVESPIRIEPKVSGMPGGLRPIVIDGSNVAMTHGKNKVFSCRGIALCVKYFQDRGHKEITVFLPHSRKTQEASRDKPITDRNILDDLERKEILHFTPSRKVKGRFITSYDDRFIIRLASMNDGVIVSNDNYRDLMHESEKWKRVIEDRLLMYNIVGDIFLVPDDPLGRTGPTLTEFLRKQPLNSNESAAVSAIPTSGQLLPTHAVPPQIAQQRVKWDQRTRGHHFPVLGAPAGPPIRSERYAPNENEQWLYMDMNRGQNLGHSMQRPAHAHTEPIRFRPPDTHRQRPQHRDHKQDVDRRKQEQQPHQENKRLPGNNDMEELTRVFEKLVTIFPNQEEKIMTVLHRYPDVKDVKKYENMIRNPTVCVLPEKKVQDVRTLPMYTQLKSIFPDLDTNIVNLLTKYPDVDDMNALCAMLLE